MRAKNCSHAAGRQAHIDRSRQRIAGYGGRDSAYALRHSNLGSGRRRRLSPLIEPLARLQEQQIVEAESPARVPSQNTGENAPHIVASADDGFRPVKQQAPREEGLADPAKVGGVRLERGHVRPEDLTEP